MRQRVQKFFLPLICFFASVRVRLTLWYMAIILFLLFFFGGGMYAAEVELASSANDAKLETQLSQDAQQLANVYKAGLLQGTQSGQVTLTSGEIALLLRPDGSVQDRQGPLTESAVERLQGSLNSHSPFTNVQLTLDNTNPGWQGPWGRWWTDNKQATASRDYRMIIAPIMENNTRMAILIVGLSRENQDHTWQPWLAHGLITLIIACLGGFWLLGKALRPVKMITRMANEINATDLRKRLNLRRRDEFGELAATFDQMLARLEAAFKRQTQFTADASHELRTPLTIIDLEINRALTQLEKPEEYQQVLAQISAENEQMTAIVNSLLLLARTDTGQIDLHSETVDLSDIALGSVERLLTLAREREIILATGELPELLVEGDPQYLSQMVMNLVENGIKYTSGVGKRVHVELECRHGHWGVIRVQDDGPGIDEEHLPYLFERFYRVDRARARRRKEQATTEQEREEPGGTGLGLAIVQWIARAHGGEIRVESKMGTGTTFEVWLPLLKREDPCSKMTD